MERHDLAMQLRLADALQHKRHVCACQHSTRQQRAQLVCADVIEHLDDCDCHLAAALHSASKVAAIVSLCNCTDAIRYSNKAQAELCALGEALKESFSSGILGGHEGGWEQMGSDDYLL